MKDASSRPDEHLQWSFCENKFLLFGFSCQILSQKRPIVNVRLGSKYISGKQKVLLENEWYKKVFQTHSLSYIKKKKRKTIDFLWVIY